MRHEVLRFFLSVSVTLKEGAYKVQPGRIYLIRSIPQAGANGQDTHSLTRVSECKASIEQFGQRSMLLSYKKAPKGRFAKTFRGD